MLEQGIVIVVVLPAEPAGQAYCFECGLLEMDAVAGRQRSAVCLTDSSYATAADLQTPLTLPCRSYGARHVMDAVAVSEL